MSGYKLHLLVYLLFAGALTYYAIEAGNIKSEPLSILLYLFVGAFYTLLPDIDIPTSVMRKFIERLCLFLIILSILAFFALNEQQLLFVPVALAVFLLMLWFLRHRGFFHSLFAGAILSLPLAIVDPILAAYAFVGYASHLAVDGKIFHLI